MPPAILLVAVAASAALSGVCGNEAPVQASALRSTEQWRLLKTQLAAEEKKLASVEKLRGRTARKLADKTTQMSEVDGELKRVQELNSQLKHAEAAKDEVLREAQGLRKDALFAEAGGASAQATASLLSVEQSMDAELEAAASAAAEQRAADLLSADAQAKKYRLDVRVMKEHLFSDEQALDKSRRLAKPLMKEEENELQGAAMLQEQLATKKTGERVTRAVDLVREEQGKVLQKQQELADLKYGIGNGTILLEVKQGQLKAEREHAEESATEATDITDRLAATESLLRTAHQQVSNLSMALTKKSHEAEAMEKDVQDLRELRKRDEADEEKKLVELQTAQQDAEGRLAKLVEKVDETQGEVKDTMTQIKRRMSTAKEAAATNAQRILREKLHAEQLAAADAAEYEAAKQQVEANKGELNKKLEQVEAESASEQAEKIKAIIDNNSNASFLMLEQTAKANLRAQQRRNQAQSDKYQLAQSHLKSQITEAKKSAEAMLGDSAGEMGMLHEAIAKTHAVEATTMYKVNQQMEQMMKHTALLKTKFQKEDVQVDEVRRKAAGFGHRIRQVEGQLQDEESKYQAMKKDVVSIFKAVEKGGAELDDAEVKGLMKSLKATRVHKEHAVSELVAKVKALREEVEAAKKAKEEAIEREKAQEQQAETQRQEAQQLQKATDSLEDLQEEFDNIASERPDLDAGPDVSVRALLQEVSQASKPAPSFLQRLQGVEA